jgi:hypothetical protein
MLLPEPDRKGAMGSATANWVVDRVDADGYEPDIIDGTQVGEFHVVAGAATVTLTETGEEIELRVGDIAYFSAGTRSVWAITESFKKFVVMSR